MNSTDIVLHRTGIVAWFVALCALAPLATGCHRVSRSAPAPAPALERSIEDGWLKEHRSELGVVGVETKGGLAKEEVLTVLEGHWRDVLVCAVPSDDFAEDVGDEVQVTLETLPTGELRQDDLGIPVLEVRSVRVDPYCLRDFVTGWRFPSASAPTTVVLSLKLRPSRALRSAVYDRLRLELGAVCREMPEGSSTYDALVVAFSRLRQFPFLTPLRLAPRYFTSEERRDEYPERVLNARIQWVTSLARRFDADDFCLPLSVRKGPPSPPEPAAVAAFVDALLSPEELRRCAHITRRNPVTRLWRTDWEAPWEDDRFSVQLKVTPHGVYALRKPWSLFVDTQCLKRRWETIRVPDGITERSMTVERTFRFRTTLAERQARQATLRDEYGAVCRDFERAVKESPAEPGVLRRVLTAALERPSLEASARETLEIVAPLESAPDMAMILRAAARERGIEDYCPAMTSWAESLPR